MSNLPNLSSLPVAWSFEDVTDELDAALDALAIGDLGLSEKTEVYHARARRHVARARQLADLVQQALTPTATTASVSPTPPSTPPTPVASAVPEPVTTHPSVTVSPEIEIVTATGGPYAHQSLVMPRGQTRWVVRDCGGLRTSVAATRDKAPVDAIPEHLLRSMTIEGYYQAEGGLCAIWTPVVVPSHRSLPA